MLACQFRLVRILVLGQVGCLRVRTWFEATANANQIPHAHVGCQRIAAWFSDLALDIHCGRLDGVRILVNQQAVARLQDDVLDRVSPQGVAQADAEDFEFAVRQVAEYLRIHRLCVLREPSSQVHCIGQMDLARGLIGSREAHIAQNGDCRWIFEVKPAEDSNRVHGLEHRRLSRIGKGSGQIEAFDTRMKVWRVEANDFGILSRGLR